MKKYLPLILLGAGILVVLGVFFVARGQKKSEIVPSDDQVTLPEIPLEKRPVVSIIPSADGHYLKLKVDNIIVDQSAKIDYLLEYQTSNDITQGVPGVTDLKGQKTFETDILLGTESSGKFRYDEGVQTGTLEVKLRDGNGKLLAKFNTDFHMQTGVTELTSQDGKFTYTLDKIAKGIFFVTMQTVGVPGASFTSVVSQNGYSVFASDKSPHTGSAKTN